MESVSIMRSDAASPAPTPCFKPSCDMRLRVKRFYSKKEEDLKRSGGAESTGDNHEAFTG